MAHTLTTCTFCGVGCGIYLETSANQIVGVYPSVSHPTNAGRICLRGWHVHEIASSPDRLRAPLLKKNGALEEVSWDEALAFIASRLTEIRQQHGPDALAFLNSPRCSNEESYLLQKFARAVIGTNNVDHGTGVYCNNSIHVLLEMIGVPAATNSIGELGSSDVIVVDGVDLARRLPTIAGVVIRAKLNGARLIVIGTRRHRVADNSDIFLQIKPGTETLLYGAIAKVIEDRGLANLSFIREHCDGYGAFRAQVREYDLLQVAETCGVPADLIEQAALAYGGAKSAALLFSTSMADRGENEIRGLMNLVLLTGNLGKPGAGVFALCEQNNLQGACDMGVLPDFLPGYRPVVNAAARDSLQKLWKAKVPANPGLSARSVLSDRGGGKIKALWLSRYDPVSTAFFADAAATLRACDLVVVQHLFMTGSAECANVVLPLTAFGEEQVSFTSTDRRIQLAQQVVDPPSGQLPAWQQFARLARLMGAGWNYCAASEVMDEITAAVPFYSGATYANLARDYGRQWPCTKDRPLGTRFLFEDDGRERRFKFVPVVKPYAAEPATNFPLSMVFGQSLYYWNQNVLVRHSETLRREYRSLFLDYPDGFVEVNPDDARQFGIRDGEKIRLRTPAGAAVAPARLSSEIRKGTIFVPYFLRDFERKILGGAAQATVVIPVRVEKETA